MSANLKQLLVALSFVAIAVTGSPATAEESYIATSSDDIERMLREHVGASSTCMVIGLIDEHGRRVFSAGKLSSGAEVDGNKIFEIGSVARSGFRTS